MTTDIHSALGKKTNYESQYNPQLLYPVPRREKREEIGVNSESLPFFGFDIWNHYEVSWLNERGKPMVAIAEIIYNCQSPNIIESKSLKLYFNSLNNTAFKNRQAVENTIKQDLEQAIKHEVSVSLHQLDSAIYNTVTADLKGKNLDDLDIDCSIYTINPDYLKGEHEDVTEELCSNLLKSNCLITNQPDWGSLYIHYKGKKINHEGLLKYIVSFRNHNEFHEQCVERIFIDILKHCKPEQLTVFARYTRRGGLDINPFRSTQPSSPNEFRKRLVRQ